MRKFYKKVIYLISLTCIGIFLSLSAGAQIIITQYYEGSNINKWIELTNLGNTAVNTASPQLKLGAWQKTGSSGAMTNAAGSGVVFNVVNLTITIPANGSVLIGNPSNASEVPYLTAASAVLNNDVVIAFNGNDGVALLDAGNNIIDAFGEGINAADISWVRNSSVSGPKAQFDINEWTSITRATVQNALDTDDPNRLGSYLPLNLPDCIAPTSQPTTLSFTAQNTNSITASFTAASDAAEYVVVRSLGNSLSSAPVDGTVYNTGDALGGGTVVSRNSTTTFTATGLSSGTKYYFYIFSLNNASCANGPEYFTTSPLIGNKTTTTLPACSNPPSQPTNFNITSFNYSFIQGSFTATVADEYLVVMSASSSLSSNPVNQTVYNVGDILGGGTVIKRGGGASFAKSSLAANTTYYFYIFSVNSNCTGGPLYSSASPLTGSQTTSAPNTGALNYYFGNLHSHSSYSDGNKDDTSKKPTDDYTFAKNSKKMDFLGIAEHNHTQAGMHLANWQPGMDAAKAATTPTFVALYGMEWGVISGGGHVVVYGIDSLIGWEAGENQIYVPKNTYTGSTGLFQIINRHGSNAIATLAHPNNSDYNGIAFSYNIGADNAIVGTAVESGPASSTNTTYSDPGNSMSFLSYYNQMLSRGYHLGAVIDHDNHYFTFGRTTKSRLVILAPALTENDLLDGMKKMHFYATQDSAAKIAFTINSQPVGSVFVGNNAPVITVNTTTTASVTSIKIMYGIPGSGTSPVQIASSSAGTLTYTDNAISDLSTGYYYADITESDASRTITSPIWYTRDDNNTLPITLTSFFAINEKDKVTLKWTTASEHNNQLFTVQKYVEGYKDYVDVGSLPGKGNSSIALNYSIQDIQPTNGLAYYRLMQKDFDGTTTYSNVVAVNRNKLSKADFTLYPNPVDQVMNISLFDNKEESTQIEVFDMAGNMVIRQAISLKAGSQTVSLNMDKLKTAVYVVKINFDGQVVSRRVNKL